MSEDLHAFLTTGLLFFVLGILAICFVLRTGFETAFPTLTKTTPETTMERVWLKFILPTMPMVVGVLMGAFITAFKYPAGLGETWGLRAMFGGGCGFCSGWFYTIIKSVIFRRWDVTVPPSADCDPRVPPEPTAPPAPGV